MSHHHYEDVIDPDKLIKQKEKEIEKLQKEKEVIIEKQEIKNKEALKLSEQLQKLKVVRDKTELAITETREKLYKLCTHEKVRTENRNYPGGYLDRAEHWTDYYCELCDQKIDEKVTYGGFG